MKHLHLLVLFCLSAIPVSSALSASSDDYSEDTVTAFRVRTDFSVDLDDDLGWAAGISETKTLIVDTPFRLRFEVESGPSSERRQYSLQYRRNDSPWLYAEAHHFPYPSAKSPPLSIIGCDAYFYGEEAEDLIAVSQLPYKPGAGITLAPTTPGWTDANATAEWEWALVVRRWADGPNLVQTGDRFAIRMVDQLGRVLGGPAVEFTVEVPDYHLGGTFVETPMRIGPYEAKNGELYFIMEPTETDNVFMMVKSTDGGKSWFEVDAANRPGIADLEGVASVLSSDGTIHILHETSDAVYYHAFCISDHPETPDQWIVDSEVVSLIQQPPVQVVDVALRPDGSLVSVYANGDRLLYQLRSPAGDWLQPRALDENIPAPQTNPSLTVQDDGAVNIAYKSGDGKGWFRQLLPSNELTSVQQLAESLGTSEDESMAILPLVYCKTKGNTFAVYRQADGFLYMTQKSLKGDWSPPMRVSDHRVITNAVDSDQAGADAVIYEAALYITYIAEADRSIYLSVVDLEKQSFEVRPIITDIDGSWVRGQILYHLEHKPVYGIIYDAGSEGGSGFNRFAKMAIP